jgi:transposase InsO family protein
MKVLRRPREFAQYSSAEFGRLLDAHKITQSFSRPRQCLFTG